MPTTEQTQKIIQAFHRKDTAAITAYSTQDLKDAIDDLGWRNKSDQNTIQREIDAREDRQEKTYQSKVRTVGYIVALAIALIAGLIIAKL